MTVFIVVALLLLLAVIVILVRPLWRFRPSASADEARAANLAILRDQLAELERERQAGTLDAQGFAESYKELQRRLLDEVTVPGAANSTDASTTDSTAAAHPHGRRTAFTLILLLLLSTALPLFAQPPGEQVEMATVLHQNGKIYLVVLVLVTIFAGVLTMLIRLERRLSRLEKNASANRPDA